MHGNGKMGTIGEEKVGTPRFRSNDEVTLIFSGYSCHRIPQSKEGIGFFGQQARYWCNDEIMIWMQPTGGDRLVLKRWAEAVNLCSIFSREPAESLSCKGHHRYSAELCTPCTFWRNCLHSLHKIRSDKLNPPWKRSNTDQLFLCKQETLMSSSLSLWSRSPIQFYRVVWSWRETLTIVDIIRLYADQVHCPKCRLQSNWECIVCTKCTDANSHNDDPDQHFLKFRVTH
jgi:hypothetical protein